MDKNYNNNNNDDDNTARTICNTIVYGAKPCVKVHTGHLDEVNQQHVAAYK